MLCLYYLSVSSYFSGLNAPKLHLGLSRAVVEAGSGLILTNWRSLTCAKISAHGRFRFSPQRGKQPPQTVSNPPQCSAALMPQPRGHCGWCVDSCSLCTQDHAYLLNLLRTSVCMGDAAQLSSLKKW